MKTALLHQGDGLRTFVIVLDTGEEVMAALRAFAASHSLSAAHFTAIGACSRVVVAYFDVVSKQYRNISIDEQVEVLSLVGDISLEGDMPKVHAHVVLGKSDATAHGGHLNEAIVTPTLEIILTETPRHLRRRHDPESGLYLIDPST